MKLVRFGPAGREKPGILDSDGKIRDLSKVVPDINGEVLANGLAKVKKAKVAKLPVVKGRPRLGPCVGGTRHFIAIGLNYADHAAETGSPIPKEPIIFSKAPNCIVGPNDSIMVPKGSTKLDYELELAIVIGRRARYIEFGEGRAQLRRRLLHLQRCFRARVPSGARRSMDEGQGRRDVRARRPLARHAR